jgi:hypothetical protein
MQPPEGCRVLEGGARGGLGGLLCPVVPGERHVTEYQPDLAVGFQQRLVGHQGFQLFAEGTLKVREQHQRDWRHRHPIPAFTQVLLHFDPTHYTPSFA